MAVDINVIWCGNNWSYLVIGNVAVFNTMRSRQNGGHFTDDILQLIVLYANCFIHIQTSHYDDVIMTTIASQITSRTSVYSTVYSDPDQRKHQSSASLAFVWGTHRDRWIPRTKGQLRGKCVHLMASSWLEFWRTDDMCHYLMQWCPHSVLTHMYITRLRWIILRMLLSTGEWMAMNVNYV